MEVQQLDLTNIILAIIGIVTPLVIGIVAIFKKLVNDQNKQNNEQQLRTENFYKDSLILAEKRENRLLDTTDRFADAHQRVADSIYALTESTRAVANVVDSQNSLMNTIATTQREQSKEIQELSHVVRELSEKN